MQQKKYVDERQQKRLGAKKSLLRYRSAVENDSVEPAAEWRTVQRMSACSSQLADQNRTGRFDRSSTGNDLKHVLRSTWIPLLQLPFHATMFNVPRMYRDFLPNVTAAFKSKRKTRHSDGSSFCL
jgi:hypothetical protein